MKDGLNTGSYMVGGRPRDPVDQAEKPESPGEGYPQPGINRPETSEGATRRSPPGPEIQDRSQAPGKNAPETPGKNAPQPGVNRPETGEGSPSGNPRERSPQPGVLTPETAGDPQPGVLTPETASGGEGTSPVTMRAGAEQASARAFAGPGNNMNEVGSREYPAMPVDDVVPSAD